MKVQSNLVGINATLVNGDADGDNQITAADLAIVLSGMDTSWGDPHFHSAADPDGDGAVTSSDLAIIQANFGLQGDW